MVGSAVFVWHSSCCLEVRGCRVEGDVTCFCTEPTRVVRYTVCGKKMMKPAIDVHTCTHGLLSLLLLTLETREISKE
jgi:hypothetical protein